MEIKKYGRYWALYDRGDLVAFVLYKKGALEIKRRMDEKNQLENQVRVESRA